MVHIICQSVLVTLATVIGGTYNMSLVTLYGYCGTYNTTVIGGTYNMSVCTRYTDYGYWCTYNMSVCTRYTGYGYWWYI